MKIYSRRGDAGQTTLAHGLKLSKSDDRLAALGDVDEVNCVIGVTRAGDVAEIDESLARIQNVLFEVGACLADPDRTAGFAAIEECTFRLETEIDQFTESTAALTNFILPGGTDSASKLHHVRAVCRRAERSVIKCRASDQEFLEIIRFLNRLSDWMFCAARWQNQARGIADVVWRPEA